jgi:hypothetical protein
MLKHFARSVALTLLVSLVSSCGQTPPAPNTAAGTYTGNIQRLFNAINYSGPASMTITSGNTMTGTWSVAPFNSAGAMPPFIVNLSGTVDSAGVLTGNGSIGATANVMPLTGNVVISTGTVSGTYDFSGGVLPFPGTFSLAR